VKITNHFNVPEPLVALARKEYYSKGKADYSVTEIMSPPRIQRLKRKHWDDMEQDVTDMLWSMLGSALHVVAERSEVIDHLNEERLFMEIDGVTLSGSIDLQQHVKGGVALKDYKFTSVWAVMNDKPEWEQQLNVYGWMVHKIKGVDIKGLQICAILRDWSTRKAQTESGYPQAQIQMVDIPIWSFDKTEKYVHERIELHKESKVQADWDEELPECTEEERWMRTTTYAVKKEGRKSAVRVFDAQEDAVKLIEESEDKKKLSIEVRKGEPVRCTGNYCGVNKWCSQYQSYLKEQKE
jgi:hypothetical protein